MFNMATMAADECRSDDTELKYRDWLNLAGKELGRYVQEGSDDENSLCDLYLDGCTPSEAATELMA